MMVIVTMLVLVGDDENAFRCIGHARIHCFPKCFQGKDIFDEFIWSHVKVNYNDGDGDGDGDGGECSSQWNQPAPNVQWKPPVSPAGASRFEKRWCDDDHQDNCDLDTNYLNEDFFQHGLGWDEKMGQQWGIVNICLWIER